MHNLLTLARLPTMPEAPRERLHYVEEALARLDAHAMGYGPVPGGPDRETLWTLRSALKVAVAQDDAARMDRAA